MAPLDERRWRWQWQCEGQALRVAGQFGGAWMIAIVATVKVQDGKGPEFEAVFGRLAAAVRADEPGNHLYQLARTRTDAQTYKVLELYSDEAAVEAHRASAHFRDIGREMGSFMAGRPEVEFLDAIT